MERWRRRSRRLTWVLLFASVTLIAPALLGAGATLPLAVVLASFAGALWLGEEQLARLPTVLGYDLGWYASDSWLGAVVGSLVTAAMAGVSPAELQALGGLAGFAGMVNYFLRPMYLFLGARLRRVAG